MPLLGTKPWPLLLASRRLTLLSSRQTEHKQATGYFFPALPRTRLLCNGVMALAFFGYHCGFASHDRCRAACPLIVFHVVPQAAVRTHPAGPAESQGSVEWAHASRNVAVWPGTKNLHGVTDAMSDLPLSVRGLGRAHSCVCATF